MYVVVGKFFIDDLTDPDDFPEYCVGPFEEFTQARDYRDKEREKEEVYSCEALTVLTPESEMKP